MLANFFQGKEINDDIVGKKSTKDQCWTALQYIELRQHQITSALNRPNNENTITLHAKKLQ